MNLLKTNEDVVKRLNFKKSYIRKKTFLTSNILNDQL